MKPNRTYMEDDAHLPPKVGYMFATRAVQHTTHQERLRAYWAMVDGYDDALSDP